MVVNTHLNLDIHTHTLPTILAMSKCDNCEKCIGSNCPYFTEFSDSFLEAFREKVQRGEGTCALDISQPIVKEGADCLSPDDKRQKT